MLQKKSFVYVLSFLILGSIFLFPASNRAYAQCSGNGVCYSPSNPGSCLINGVYTYNAHTCTGQVDPLNPGGGCVYTLTSSTVYSNQPLNMAAPNGFGCDPNVCGGASGGGNFCQGSPPGSAGGTCGQQGSQQAGTCSSPSGQGGTAVCGNCGQYTNYCCWQVPSSCASLMGCPASGGGVGTGGGNTGGTTSSCTLTCPGQTFEAFYGITPTPDPNAGGGSAAGGGNTGGGSASGGSSGGATAGGGSATGGGTPVQYFAEGIAETLISFKNASNFLCANFQDGLGYDGECPKASQVTPSPTPTGPLSPTIPDPNTGGGSATGGSNAAGGSSGGTINWPDFDWPVKFHMLDGDNEKTYTATARDGSNGGSCSCSVTLTCQTSLQDSPNTSGMIQDGCAAGCDFTVSPDQAAFNTAQTFTLSNPAGYTDLKLEYDDGTTDDPATSPATHTYANAGVYDIKLTCTNPATSETESCTRRMHSYCGDPVGFPTPTATPTPTPGAWFKVKDSSVHKRGTLTNQLPATPVAFDSDDTGTCSETQGDIACFNIGQSGVVLAQGSMNFGSHPASDRDWTREDSSYTLNNLLTPDTFIEYAKARKSVNTVTALTPEELEADTINLFEDVYIEVIDDDNVENEGDMVLIVDGDLVIDMGASYGNTFNAVGNAIAIIVTGKLEISSQTTELNGIFVANEVDYTYDVPPIPGYVNTPLKINGNVVSMTDVASCASKRIPTDTSKPSCFMKFDVANQFLPLAEILSTRTYEWTELVP